MFKKFLNGLVFGAGFGISFIAVVVIYFQFFFQPTFEWKMTPTNEVVDTAPEIKKQQKFLGSPGVYKSGFLHNKIGSLAEGPGEIVGKATVNNKPVAGLKLKLALNGSVMSQWVTTDAEGKYVVKVPYGEYKIDGFELDSNTANSVLDGKIDHPQLAHSTGTFLVDRDNVGRGLNFKFVDPVRKKITKNQFSTKEDIVLNWEPYPGATKYLIQIYEKTDPHMYIRNNTIFNWSKRPEVTNTSFNLKEHGVELKPERFYVVEIDAVDENMGIISRTYRMHTGYDFEVIE